ncbi:MAG: ATP phosphoribosyltransferase regulatory subunit [Clostridia bacterium]|nr:ATP phosphoribosyltransferase regulatory subunit [Clostridia bacterium]
MTENILRKEEKAIFDLRALYESYGYKRYKMSKFEEYDLYAENRSFIAGGNIITFNDTHGKLLALKPDVTLSIVKNAAAGERLKEYYNENVYRAVDGEYREIMQVGIESIGDVDLYTVCEVLMLAKKSLARISDRYLLDLSSAAFVGGLFEGASIPYEAHLQLLECVSGKNTHDMDRIAREYAIDGEFIETLKKIASLYGSFESVLPEAESLAVNDAMKKALCELKEIHKFLSAVGEGDNLRLDFSLINDMSYYDGLVFRGYIDGVPEGILAGGRYDKLMEKMGKHTGAVGFAIYMNLLDLYFDDARQYDADILVTYEDGADLIGMTKMIEMLSGGGRTVRVQAETGDSGVKCREHYRYTKGGLEIAET